MTTLRPAKVRGYWTGDFTVLEPGRFKGEEILKPFCIYGEKELSEIRDQIAAQIGHDPGTIIEVVNKKGELQNYAGK